MQVRLGEVVRSVGGVGDGRLVAVVIGIVVALLMGLAKAVWNRQSRKCDY